MIFDYVDRSLVNCTSIVRQECLLIGSVQTFMYVSTRKLGKESIARNRLQTLEETIIYAGLLARRYTSTYDNRLTTKHSSEGYSRIAHDRVVYKQITDIIEENEEHEREKERERMREREDNSNERKRR